MSTDPAVHLLEQLVGFLQTKEVIHFFDRMEERIVNECLNANPTPTVMGDDANGTLPCPDGRNVAPTALNLSRGESSTSPVTRAPALNLSRGETSTSPFTRAQARRGIQRSSGPQRQPRLLPRMHRRFLRSKTIDNGPVNTMGPDGGGELRFKSVVGGAPESMLQEAGGCRLEINLGPTNHLGSVEQVDHTNYCARPQLRDLNFVLIDTEQDRVRTMNEMMRQGNTHWYYPHQESSTSLRPMVSQYGTRTLPVASSGIDLAIQHEVHHNQQKMFVQRAGEDVMGIAMNPPVGSACAVATGPAVCDHIIKTRDTTHDFTFPATVSCQPTQGLGSMHPTEDFLQLACIPVCTRNPNFVGGNLLPPPDVTSGAGESTRPHGKSPVNPLMERRQAAERKMVPGNSLNPAHHHSGTTSCNCPVHAALRRNAANSENAEISLNNLPATSPANSRNLATKRRGRRYFPTRSSREPTSFSNMMTTCSSLHGETRMNQRGGRQQRRQGKKEGQRRRRQQSALMCGRQCNTSGSAGRTVANVSAGCVGEHEPTNFDRYLAHLRVLQETVMDGQHGNSESDKENVCPHENKLEIHVPPVERQQKGVFGGGDVPFAVLSENLCERHRRSFPCGDGRRQDMRLEAGDGPSRHPREGEQLIDVNRLPDGDEERPSDMNTWMQLFSQLSASERRCQSLLDDNDNLRRLNLTIKGQLLNLVDNYKAMLAENASLIDKLRGWRTQELDRILDGCRRLA